MTGKPRIRLTRDVPSLQGIFKAGTVMEVLTVNVGDGYEHVGLFGRRTKVPRITGLPADAFEFVGDGEPLRVVGSAEPMPASAVPVVAVVAAATAADCVVKTGPLPSEIGSLDDLGSLEDFDLEGL